MTQTALSDAPQVGTLAPEFALRDQYGQTVRLSDFRGSRNVVLVFYPYAFTPTCTGELCRLRDESADFVSDDVVTLAISCDPSPALKAFADAEGITYPLLSDFWPHGEVSRAYGVFFAERGFSLRGTFVIDMQGVVRWLVVNSAGDARDTDDYRAALAGL